MVTDAAETFQGQYTSIPFLPLSASRPFAPQTRTILRTLRCATWCGQYGTSGAISFSCCLVPHGCFWSSWTVGTFWTTGTSPVSC